jgi:hypothetical protein
MLPGEAHFSKSLPLIYPPNFQLSHVNPLHEKMLDPGYVQPITRLYVHKSLTNPHALVLYRKEEDR